MHGIILVHKPLGLTSHDVVYRLRKQLNTKKIGHAGTLDPEAEGLLICAVNQATRCLKYFESMSKHYRFTIRFGVLTDTLDHTGKILSEASFELPAYLDLDAFNGQYIQSPPAYSAVKVQGKKLYQYAREGKPIPVAAPRTLTIHTLRQKTPLDALGEATFEVLSSKGLYVRQLALDIAKQYGTVAHTTSIKRLGIGPFSLSNAQAIETISHQSLLSIDQALSFIDSYEMSAEEAKKVTHGQALALTVEQSLLRMRYQQQLYAIYKQKAPGHYQADIVFPR